MMYFNEIYCVLVYATLVLECIHNNDIHNNYVDNINDITHVHVVIECTHGLSLKYMYNGICDHGCKNQCKYLFK